MKIKVEDILKYNDKGRITHFVDKPIDELESLKHISIFRWGGVNKKVGVTFNYERIDYEVEDGGSSDIKKAIKLIKQQIFDDSGEPMIYKLENESYIKIDGELIKFGCRCEDPMGNYITFTLKEIDELRKEGKIKDNGWRHLVYIEHFKIKDNEVFTNYVEFNDDKTTGYMSEKPKELTQKEIDNLIFIGFDISKLKNQPLIK